MNELNLTPVIEATLLAAGRPVTTQQLVDLFDERERPTVEQVREALAALASEYESRGIELREVASGWRVQVRAKYADVVSRLWQERPSRYSRALLETLALIAYRQPITRGEIEEIRGVTVSSTIMRTLQERNWIRVVGHREVPGRPELLGTTREFLDYFGLKGLDQLPTLAELKDVETIGVQLELPAGEAVEGVQEVQPLQEAQEVQHVQDLQDLQDVQDVQDVQEEEEVAARGDAAGDEDAGPERSASPLVAEADRDEGEGSSFRAPAPGRESWD